MTQLGKRQKALLAVVLVALLASSSLVYLRLSSAQPGSAGRALAAVVSTTSSSPQASRYVTEYQVGGVNLEPNAIASDSKGDIWFTLAADYAIGELSPASGTTHEFRIPHENGSLVSWGIAADNPKGLIWFTDQLEDSVWSFNVSSSGFTRHQLPKPLSSPYQVAVDRGGNVWFTEIDGGRIGEITAQGVMQEYTVPTGSSTGSGETLTGPAGIAIGKGGVVWFTEVYENSVGSLSNGTFHQYPLAGASSPTGIALDSQGDVWVTLHGGSDIAELDPSTNSIRLISTSVPAGVQSTLPYFLAVDSHGEVWFDEHYGNAIARFTPSNQTLVEFEIPTKVSSLGNISGAFTIGLDSAGRPWFTEFYSGKVGMVAPGALDLGIAVGPSQSAGKLDLSGDGSAAMPIEVQGGSSSTLTYSQGAGPPLQISFSPSSGNGSYSSTMTVKGPSTASLGATVEVTVSVVSSQLVCSEVIDVAT